MDIQYVVVALIVLGALGYVATIVRRQARSLTKKGACETDCGCSSSKKEVKAAR